MDYEIKGTKLVEIPYLKKEISNQTIEDSILIVGERSAEEGILQQVLEKEFNVCVCTDIINMFGESPLKRIMSENNKVLFIQEDFIEFSERVKYEYIICINVLEHFGMNFGEIHGFSGALSGDDYIRWNHDLRAIEKMIKLLSDNPKSKIIITVPAGQPIMMGDINGSNNMPFLRRYDQNRIEYINKMVESLNAKISNTFYFSENFNDWYESNIQITGNKYSSACNSYTPNMIWAFTITK